jgi:leucyl aminopeptidase
MIIDLKQSINLDEVDGLIVCLGKDTLVPDYLSVPVNQLKENETFESKIGQMQPLSLVYEGKYHEIALIGIGDEDTFSPTKYRKSLAEAFKALKAKKVKKITVDASAVAACTSVDKKLARMMGETFIMSDYEFNDYKTDAKPSTVTEVFVSGLELDLDSFEEGKILGETNVFSRYLTNMPANVMTPDKLAELAKSYCEAAKIEVEIFEEAAIEALGMQAYLAVAKASSNPPRLIVMRHKGNPDSDKTIAFVGKGLTYDSGGLSIKPTASMVTMKDDMGGASAVISAMGAIGKLNLKVNVTAVVAACENMISGMSYKPGDIIGSMGGKSIYIGNTDAEGRLTLVDAVTYAIERENASFVLDIATLTGAAIHCLGSEAAPVISNNDDFFNLVDKAFAKANETIWRMPILDAYKELVKHEQADLTNTAGSPGTITAGIFIGEFVKEVPWVHIDIAGTAFKEKADGVYSKGGTGSGAIPLVYLAKKMSK